MSHEALAPPAAENRSNDNENGSNTSAVKARKPYMLQNVSTRNMDLLMLACCFITGIVDAAVYNA